eukprot:scaffold4134_cov74-Cylindrotheca_fusiformis.AAC.1
MELVGTLCYGKLTIPTDQSLELHFTQHQLNIYINTEQIMTLYMDTSRLAQEVPSRRVIHAQQFMGLRQDHKANQ